MEALDRTDAWIADYAAQSGTVLRLALGIVILLAGAHKLIAPAQWHAYLPPLFADLWPTAIAPLDPVFVLFGVSEVLFGLLLLADWHTPTVAAVTGLSILGVVVNLVIAVVQGEPFADVLVRDVGLTLLAFGVALEAARTRRP